MRVFLPSSTEDELAALLSTNFTLSVMRRRRTVQHESHLFRGLSEERMESQDILYVNFYSLNAQGSLFYRSPCQETDPPPLSGRFLFLPQRFQPTFSIDWLLLVRHKTLRQTRSGAGDADASGQDLPLFRALKKSL